MFLCSKKNKNGVYYLYLMEGKVNPKTNKYSPRIVESFGRLDDFKKAQPDKYAQLVRDYGDKKNKRKAEAALLINKLYNSQETYSESSELFSKFNNLMPQNISHLALRRLWIEELQMTKFFDYLRCHENLNIKYNISEIALYFSMLKIVSPMSYLEGCEVSPRFLGDPMSQYSTDDVYRCLQLLAGYKEQIMRHVNKRIDSLVKREKSLLFFDCTNCYFETPYNDTYWFRRKALRVFRRKLRKEHEEFKHLSDRELNLVIEGDFYYSYELDELIKSFGEPLRMFGPSKEERTDLPLVSIALVVDEHAIPIDFKVFSGNQAETTTLIEVVRGLKTKYKIRNAVLVADAAAMNGTRNLSLLLKEGLGFSVSKSALSFSAKIRNQLNLSGFSKMKDEAGNELPMLYKIVDYDNATYDLNGNKTTRYEIKCKMMITYSESRKIRDLATLEYNLKRAQQAVDNKEKMTFSTTGWKQLVKIASEEDTTATEEQSKDSEEKGKKKQARKVQFASSLNLELIEKRKLCAGFASILYHEPPDSEAFTPEYVSSLYHHQVQIEECFRIMKNDFEIRPLYVRERPSVEGHILLCVLALIVIRLIQRKFAELGITITAEQIKNTFKELKLMLLNMGNDRSLFIKSYEAQKRNCLRSKTEQSEDKHLSTPLMKVLGVEINEPVNTWEQLREIFKIKSIKCSEYQTELIGKYYSQASKKNP